MPNLISLDQRYKSPNCFCYFAAFTQDTVCVGLSRVGSDAQRIVSATLQELTQIDLGEPLHSLIIPGEMHSLERDMLLQFDVSEKTKNLLSSLCLWRQFILAVRCFVLMFKKWKYWLIYHMYTWSCACYLNVMKRASTHNRYVNIKICGTWKSSVP